MIMKTEEGESELYASYGENILAKLNELVADTYGESTWTKADEDGAPLVSQTDVFGLQKATYERCPDVYLVLREDDLAGVELDRYSSIVVEEGGVLCAADTLRVSIPVTNNGTITGGTFEGPVTNATGTITGGTYTGAVENQSGATIAGGNFAQAQVENSGTLTGGAFEYFTLSTENETVTLTIVNDINLSAEGEAAKLLGLDPNAAGKLVIGSGAAFDGGAAITAPVEVAGGTITGGTFSDTVDIKDGEISGGTFVGDSDSLLLCHGGIVSGGVFDRSVAVYREGRISGGTFNGRTGIMGTVMGEGDTVPTINGEFAVLPNGVVAQPCNFGENAQIYDTVQGVLEVAMTVRDGDYTGDLCTSEYPEYGDNVLATLNTMRGAGGRWMKIEVIDGQEVATPVTSDEVFGLSRQTYWRCTTYYVSAEDSLEGVDLTGYETIVVEEGAVLCAADSLTAEPGRDQRRHDHRRHVYGHGHKRAGRDHRGRKLYRRAGGKQRHDRRRHV